MKNTQKGRKDNGKPKAENRQTRRSKFGRAGTVGLAVLGAAAVLTLASCGDKDNFTLNDGGTGGDGGADVTNPDAGMDGGPARTDGGQPVETDCAVVNSDNVTSYVFTPPGSDEPVTRAEGETVDFNGKTWTVSGYDPETGQVTLVSGELETKADAQVLIDNPNYTRPIAVTVNGETKVLDENGRVSLGDKALEYRGLNTEGKAILVVVTYDYEQGTEVETGSDNVGQGETRMVDGLEVKVETIGEDISGNQCTQVTADLDFTYPGDGTYEMSVPVGESLSTDDSLSETVTVKGVVVADAETNAVDYLKLEVTSTTVNEETGEMETTQETVALAEGSSHTLPSGVRVDFAGGDYVQEGVSPPEEAGDRGTDAGE